MAEGDIQSPRINVIEAIEAYSNAHNETVEELLEWPWKRFEAFYLAHVKREAVQKAESTKNAIISGLWSNSNWDDDKGSRSRAIDDIDNTFQEMLWQLYDKMTYEEKQKAIEENPFFAAMNFDYMEGKNENSAPDRTTDNPEYEVDQN